MYVETLKRISRALVDAPCTALIAGGAVRDIDNGKPYKDIDIFCLYDEDQDPDHLVDQIGNHLGLRDIAIHNHIEYQENWAGIHSVWDARFQVHNDANFAPQLFDVQLVFQKKDPEIGYCQQVTNKFDLNICQAVLEWDRALEKFFVIKTEAYKRDKENGTITLTQHGLDLPVGPKRDKTRVRARRIGQKLNFRTDLEWGRGLNPVRDIDLGPNYEALVAENNRLMQYLLPIRRVKLNVEGNNNPVRWEGGGLNDWF